MLAIQSSIFYSAVRYGSCCGNNEIDSLKMCKNSISTIPEHSDTFKIYELFPLALGTNWMLAEVVG